jgi:hypothetical protein
MSPEVTVVTLATSLAGWKQNSYPNLLSACDFWWLGRGERAIG